MTARELLKGGFALDLRLADRARATRDVDIDRRPAEEELPDAVGIAPSLDSGHAAAAATLLDPTLYDKVAEGTPGIHEVQEWSESP